jgi:hypothetical protein
MHILVGIRFFHFPFDVRGVFVMDFLQQLNHLYMGRTALAERMVEMLWVVTAVLQVQRSAAGGLQ